MEEIMPDGSLKKDRGYTRSAVLMDFRRTKRPPKERNRLCQADNLVLIWLTTGSQNNNRRRLPPIGSPKYTNETLPTLQFNLDAASINQESDICYHVIGLK